MIQTQDTPSRIHKMLLWVTAVTALSAGLMLIFSQKLPDRVDFSGVLVGEQYFAPEVGALAPPFTLPDLAAAEPVDLLSLRGTPVILNFWATWCPPCEAEMPELIQFSSEYPSVRLLSVNVGESPAQVSRWLAERGLELQVLMDLNSEAASAYRLRGQPTTFVIAPDGAIVSAIYGPTTVTQLQSIVEPLL